MRSRFDEQLALLNKELIEMGALCEEVIALAAKALTEATVQLAAKVAPLGCAKLTSKERDDRVAVPETAACSSSPWRATCGRYPPR